MLDATNLCLDQDVPGALQRTFDRIAPIWDLTNYIAVNPFLGYLEIPFNDAVRSIRQTLHTDILPPIDFYRQQWLSGGFSRMDFESNAAASNRVGAGEHENLSWQQVALILNGEEPIPRQSEESSLTLLEQFDWKASSDVSELVRRWISRWLIDHVAALLPAEPDSSMMRPSLFEAWLQSARVDRSLEVAGIAGWRNWASHLPNDHIQALNECLCSAPIPLDLDNYLIRCISNQYGWASYFRRVVENREEIGQSLFAQLLAICVCSDIGVRSLLGRDGPSSPGDVTSITFDDHGLKLALQNAVENGFARRMFASFHPVSQASQNSDPEIQAVFCIDVRSERLRRQLELESDAIETIGFAGFFGVSLEWQAGQGKSARCPVLLKPSIQVQGAPDPVSSNLKSTVDAVQKAPSAFSIVEMFGVRYALGLIRETFPPRGDLSHDESSEAFDLDQVSLTERTSIAEGILKNTGLVNRLSPLVLLCGHESKNSNNSHAAGLDCGACGGHSGALNARVAAAMLNDPDVRGALLGKGIRVPSTTWFIAGLHNTTTDDVKLLDLEKVPDSAWPRIDALQSCLESAGKSVRRERAPELNVHASSDDDLRRAMLRRATDGSEVRPEWGLARNAAFVCARRTRTRGVNLSGRSFLHDYNFESDVDGSVLALILTAPMVVASWINLQYFASTSAPERFGAGAKPLQNRVGNLGLVLGNEGDLQIGLSRESVFDLDGGFFHEPLRLQVVVEAPFSVVENTLQNHPQVLSLVENSWIRMFAIEPDSDVVWIRGEGGNWQTFSCPSNSG